MVLQGDMLGVAGELWALREFDAATVVLPNCAEEFCLVLFDWEDVANFVKEIEEG